MQVSNLIIEGFKNHEKVEYKEILELVHKGYEKYNLEDVPLNVIAGYKNTEILTHRGTGVLGDREYSYAVARTKDTKERVNIAVFNFEKKYKMNYLQSAATALGDILSCQYDKFISDDLEDDMAHYIRSPFAVTISTLMLKEIRYSAATRYEFRYAIGHIPFDTLVSLKEISVSDKLNGIVECIAYAYAIDKSIKDFFSSESIKFNAVLELEKGLRNAYDKMLRQEKLTEEELKKLINEIKRVRNLLSF